MGMATTKDNLAQTRRRTHTNLRCLSLPVLLLAGLSVAADTTDEGKRLAMERSKGNCLACHAIEDGELPGNVGPPLQGMKQRFPDREALHQQVCDATVRNPYSRMPPFCRHGILTNQEVELIIDYLYTL
jgi:sulfur-oxidizing protein SoxX